MARNRIESRIPPLKQNGSDSVSVRTEVCQEAIDCGTCDALCYSGSVTIGGMCFVDDGARFYYCVMLLSLMMTSASAFVAGGGGTLVGAVILYACVDMMIGVDWDVGYFMSSIKGHLVKGTRMLVLWCLLEGWKRGFGPIWYLGAPYGAKRHHIPQSPYGATKT